MKISTIFAWYDLWVGAYWDRFNRRLYVLPLPCLGVVLEFPRKPERPAYPFSGMFVGGDPQCEHRFITTSGGDGWWCDDCSAEFVRKLDEGPKNTDVKIIRTLKEWCTVFGGKEEDYA